MKATDILYIEDNEDYIQFVRRAVNRIDTNLSFSVLMDGKNTLDFIEGVDTDKQLPRLILLDLDLPDYNGLDLLARIRSNKATRYIPVVMFSSSENQKDMQNAFDGGANAYLVKPMGLTPLTETLESICNFWLHHNHQPADGFVA